ncbi:MAG: MarR family winged helix-turn-helix transcriptional regulator [Christensenellales bacterium]
MLICDLSILHKYGKQRLDEVLAPYGCNWQEMVVLMVLERVPAADQTLLSLFLQTDKGNVTKLLKQMELKGLVARSASRGDSRRKDIRMGAAGLALLPDLHEAMVQWETACFSGLSPEQVSIYKDICAVMAANLRPGGQKSEGLEERRDNP